MKVILRTVFVLAFVFTQAGTSFANVSNDDEATQIAAAMKLYAEAGPMQLADKKRAELLDQAASILNKVIENNPRSLDAHRKLMGVYLLKQDYSNGIRTMQGAINLSPEDPKLFIGLAFLYEHSGALDFAKAMLDRALELDPKQKLALEYKETIEKKIERLRSDQAHAQMPTDANHGKSAASPHHSMPKK